MLIIIVTILILRTHFSTYRMKSFKDCLPQPFLFLKLGKYNYIQDNFLKKLFLFTDI